MSAGTAPLGHTDGLGDRQHTAGGEQLAERIEPVTAVCAAMYAADPVPAYAFMFRVAATGTRFTVYARAEDRTRALAAGFQVHVTKPVEPARLAAIIGGLAREHNDAVS